MRELWSTKAKAYCVRFLRILPWQESIGFGQKDRKEAKESKSESGG